MSEANTHVARPIPAGVSALLKPTLLEEKRTQLPSNAKPVRSFPSREIIMKLIAWFEQA